MVTDSTTLFKPSKPTSAVFILGQASVWHGAILAVLGLFVLYHNFIIHGFIGIVVALLTGTTRKGIEVDISAQRYRFFTMILSLRIGNWQTLPNIQRVVMKYYSDLVTHGKPGRMRTDADQRYIIMFSIPDSTQGIIIHEAYGYEPALNLIKALANFLGVEAKVYDKIL